MSESDVNKVWSYWLLWRSTGRRLDFSNALSMPEWILTGIMSLDGLFQKLELQQSEKRSSNE